MNVMGAGGCLMASWQCVKWAIGIEEQHLFSDGHLWVWWPFAAVWLAHAVGFVLKMVCPSQPN